MTSLQQQFDSVLDACRPQQGLAFSIHNLSRICVPGTFPFARALLKEFSEFSVGRLQDCDLLITDRMDELDGFADPVVPGVRAGGFAELPAHGVRLLFREHRIVLACRRDPLPYLLPLIQWQLLQRGCSLVHAAGVALKGRGVLLAAAGGTGKTTAVSALCRREHASYLGDDLTILTRQGALLSFPKPLFLYPYHRALYPHVFRDKRKPVVPRSLSSPIARIRAAVRPMLRNHPRLEDFARRYTPEHIHTPWRAALPGVPLCNQCRLSLVMFLQRTTLRDGGLSEIDPAQETARLGATLAHEMGSSARKVLDACALGGMIPFHEYFGLMNAILRDGVRAARAFRLEIPARLDSEATASLVAEAVTTLLGGGGNDEKSCPNGAPQAPALVRTIPATPR